MFVGVLLLDVSWGEPADEIGQVPAENMSPKDSKRLRAAE